MENKTKIISVYDQWPSEEFRKVDNKVIRPDDYLSKTHVGRYFIHDTLAYQHPKPISIESRCLTSFRSLDPRINYMITCYRARM